MTLIRSISGVRGVYGESLDGALAARYAAAFARTRALRHVVVGRDSRPSGPELLRAVTAGFTSEGCRVIDLGLCATPGVQVSVEETGADGGLILTASHNPSPYNGLKFVAPTGIFLDGGEVHDLFEAVDEWRDPIDTGRVDAPEREARAVEWHVGRALSVPEIDADAIGRAGLGVAVDGCRSVGGLSTVRALERAGVRVVPVDCEPDGQFTRGLEPVPEHLEALGRAVRESGCDFGVAHDPDGDRAALVDAEGRPVGEEMTLAIAVEHRLRHGPGPVVVNLSTSRIHEDLAAEYGVTCHRTPVGEIQVVRGMQRVGAPIGGEGNGGVILTSAHLGRDGTVAALLTAAHLASGKETLAEVRARLDRYIMVKSKIPSTDWPATREVLCAAFPDADRDESDGLRFAWPGRWLHVRPSGTEPILRIIAEAESVEIVRKLVGRARDVAESSASRRAGADTTRGAGSSS